MKAKGLVLAVAVVVSVGLVSQVCWADKEGGDLSITFQKLPKMQQGMNGFKPMGDVVTDTDDDNGAVTRILEDLKKDVYLIYKLYNSSVLKGLMPKVSDLVIDTISDVLIEAGIILYEVKEGDTLSKIAENTVGFSKMDWIIEVNDIEERNDISIGDIYIIPLAEEVKEELVRIKEADILIKALLKDRDKL